MTKENYSKTLHKYRNTILSKKIIAENALQIVLDCGNVMNEEIKRCVNNLLRNLEYKYGVFAHFRVIEFYDESETRTVEDKHIHIVLVFPHKAPDLSKKYIKKHWCLSDNIFIGNLMKGYTKGLLLYLTQNKSNNYLDEQYTKFQSGAKFFTISQNFAKILNSTVQVRHILVEDLSEIITIAKEGGALIRKKTHRYNGICYIDKI